jgi:endoglucanase
VTLERACSIVQKGDRLCWAKHWEENNDELVCSPFLDNRIACALIADWYQSYAHLLPNINVVLAATAMEEINGFGANVLARQVQADLVIALDVTYENEKQSVHMGQGPVITLSDASVILSPKERDCLLTCKHPLQTEVYNTSGTDARAFPVLGNTMPVIALLLATRGNHSPLEMIHKKDLETWAPTLAEVVEKLLAR